MSNRLPGWLCAGTTPMFGDGAGSLNFTRGTATKLSVQSSVSRIPWRGDVTDAEYNDAEYNARPKR